MKTGTRWDVRRTRPYTKAGIARLSCIRCGHFPAHATWSICADGNQPRPLCQKCDVELNRLVLQWAGHPRELDLILEYRKKIALTA